MNVVLSVTHTHTGMSNQIKYMLIDLDIHQQNAQITNKVQSAPYHSQTPGKPLMMAHKEPKHV
jgi:hypothetical protein